MKKVLVTFLFVCVFGFGLVSASVNDGLVSYWKFEDNLEDGVGSRFGKSYIEIE